MSGVAHIGIDALPTMRDIRGSLTVLEFARFVPFPVARLFYVRDVPAGAVRGEHGHYRCSQYMICESGRLRIALSDGKDERTMELLPGHAILVTPGIFAIQTYLEAGTTLLVLCDRAYDKNDYFHTMRELLAFQSNSKESTRDPIAPD